MHNLRLAHMMIVLFLCTSFVFAEDSFTIPEPEGSSFEDIVFSEANQALYICDRDNGRVLEFDLLTNSFTQQWSVGGNPYSIDISADGTLLYVGSSGSWGIIRIDLTTDSMTMHPTVPHGFVDGGPVTFMVVGNNDKVWYVTDYSSVSNEEAIWFADLSTDSHTYLVSHSDQNLTRSDDHGRVLFYNDDLTYIYDGDGTVLLDGVNTGLSTYPNKMALNQDGTRWVTSASDLTYSASINEEGTLVTQLQGPIITSGVYDVEWIPNSNTTWYRTVSTSGAELEEYTTNSDVPYRTFDLSSRALEVESNTDGSVLYLRMDDCLTVFSPDGTLPDISPSVPDPDYFIPFNTVATEELYETEVGRDAKLAYDYNRERIYIISPNYGNNICVFDLVTKTFLPDINTLTTISFKCIDIMEGGNDLLIGGGTYSSGYKVLRVNVDSGSIVWTANTGSVFPSFLIVGKDQSITHTYGDLYSYTVQHSDGTAVLLPTLFIDRFGYVQRSWDYNYAFMTSSYSNGTNWRMDLATAIQENKISLKAYGKGATSNWDGSIGVVCPGPFVRNATCIQGQLTGGWYQGVLSAPGTRWISIGSSAGIYDIDSGCQVSSYSNPAGSKGVINVTANQIYNLYSNGTLHICEFEDTPPTLSAPVSTVDMAATQTLTLNVTGHDVDGTQLEYRGFSLPDNCTFSKNGNLNFTPTASMSGTSHDLTLFAVPIDGIANSRPYTLTINVLSSPTDTTGPSFVSVARDGHSALLLTFDEALSIGDNEPSIVTISNDGASGMSANPDSFTWTGSGPVYRAEWNTGSFPTRGNLTITVDSELKDLLGNDIQSPLSLEIPGTEFGDGMLIY